MTHALLGSYAVQSDVGDYNPETADGIHYLKEYNFYKSQTDELLEKIAELHKTHKYENNMFILQKKIYF